MKKILLFAIIVNTMVIADAQDFIPVVRENVQWIYDFGYDTPEKDRKFQEMVIEFKGDTVINGNTYKKCYRTYTVEDIAQGLEDGVTIPISTTPELIACCREFVTTNNGERIQNMTVIYNDNYIDQMEEYNNCTLPYNENGVSQEYCVYQCILNYSDYKLDNPFSRFIDEIRKLEDELVYNYLYNFDTWTTIEVGGPQKDRMFLKHDVYSWMPLDDKEVLMDWSYWIEGIGFNFSKTLVSNIISPSAQYRDLAGTECLHYVKENGRCIYIAPPYCEEEKLSAVDVVKHENSNFITDNRYYNLMGQPVSNPSAGIYIHNGKKVIVK